MYKVTIGKNVSFFYGHPLAEILLNTFVEIKKRSRKEELIKVIFEHGEGDSFADAEWFPMFRLEIHECLIYTMEDIFKTYGLSSVE